MDKVIDDVVETFGSSADNAPAHFASGYLAELMGEDYDDYIINCYTVNDDLTTKLDLAMDYYAAGDRRQGDEVLYGQTRDLWSAAMVNCPKSNTHFQAIWDHQDAFMAQPDA